MFQAGLDYLAGRTDLINRVIEIDLRKEKIDIQELELP